jgi:hypothetical protein
MHKKSSWSSSPRTRAATTSTRSIFPVFTRRARTLIHTIMQTTVLGKGGHTVAVQYAAAKNVTFALKGWNLAVQAYPQPDEPLQTEEPSKGGSSK